jgi:hypothetical protein
MQHTAINPWEWSLQFGFNQAESIQGHERVLVCSGQTSSGSRDWRSPS